MSELKLKRALVRLLWVSVADRAECTCYPDDQCHLCYATIALGIGRWVSHAWAYSALHYVEEQLNDMERS